MKKYLKIILIGAASWSKDKNRYGGQWSNIIDLVNNGVIIMAVDPEHKKEPDRYIEEKTGVKIYRSNYCGVYKMNHLNIYETDAELFFKELLADCETYYLVLSFTGIQKECPSFEVARKLGIKNKFFWDVRNALFLSMGCLCKPFNLWELLNKLDISPYNEFDSIYVYKKLDKLNKLQEFYYGLQNNMDALSRAYVNNIIPDWTEKSLRKLKNIGIRSMGEANEEYMKMQDLRNIGIERLIRDEMEKLDILKFWDERENDFFV